MSVKKIKNTRHLLGAILGLLLIMFGCVRRARRSAHAGDYVTGIAFHNPNKKLFEKSIKWLKNNKYVFISTKELISILKKKSKPPKGAVWITFDDGWRQNIKAAIPIIKDFNIPATFFIMTGAVSDSGYFWWKTIQNYNHEPHSFGKENYDDLDQLSKKSRQTLFEQLLRNSRRKYPRDAMTTEEVIALSKLPQITIGCHTVNHWIITDCTENEIKSEVFESKIELEKLINNSVKTFAYPSGKFDERGKKILKQYGFELAATSENRLIGIDDDNLLIPRFISMNEGFFLENVCHMVGIWEPIVKKIKLYTQKILPAKQIVSNF